MSDILHHRPWRAFAISLVALGAVACGSADSSQQPPADGRVSVVATTTILGDIATILVEADGTVDVLLPIGVDPHDYQASAKQAAAIHNADLVVANGLDLEEGLLDVLESATADGANVFAVAPRLGPVPLRSSGNGDSTLDPHVWLDPVRMADAARLIAIELAAIESSIDWAARAETYGVRLLEADQQIRQILSVIPDDQRRLVTNHDSLGYFLARYQFDLVGVVVGGGSTLADPSSSDLSALAAAIRDGAIPAIFTESTESHTLAEAVAAESGIGVVELYTGSLGEPGSGAETLIGMLLTNASRIADAFG